MVKVNCYLATKPEVEGFRDQCFVLPDVESLRVKSLWLLENFLKGRSQTSVYQSNSKARSDALRAYY